MEKTNQNHFESYLAIVALLNENYINKSDSINIADIFEELNQKLDDFSQEVFGFPLKVVIEVINRSKAKLIDNLSTVSAGLYLLNEDVSELDLNIFHSPIIFDRNEKTDELLTLSKKVYDQAVTYKTPLGKLGIRANKIENFKDAILSHKNIFDFFNKKLKQSDSTLKMFNEIENVFEDIKKRINVGMENRLVKN